MMGLVMWMAVATWGPGGLLLPVVQVGAVGMTGHSMDHKDVSKTDQEYAHSTEPSIGEVRAGVTTTAAAPRRIKRFLVLTLPRSGSTWFCLQSPELGGDSNIAAGEEAMISFYKEMKSTEEYLQKVEDLFQHLEAGHKIPSGEPDPKWKNRIPLAAGFKIMYHQLPKGDRSASLGALLRYAKRHDILIVHYWRENQFARYLSTLAISSGITTYHGPRSSLSTLSEEESDSSTRQETRVHVDVTDAVQKIRTYVESIKDVAAFLRNDPYDDVLTLRYETAEGLGGAYEADMIHQRLSVPTRLAYLDEVPTLRNVSSCEARVKNWAEVAAYHPLKYWVDICEGRPVYNTSTIEDPFQDTR